MKNGRDYSADAEFRKLRARRSDVDLTVAALELARDAYANLDFGPTLRWIGARADELAGPVARSRTEIDVLGRLADCIAGTHEIFGEPDAYHRADSSFLHRVIESRRGIPISLSVLYMAVAGRVGIDLHGVSAPMHYLTRYESADGPMFLDPFFRGRILQSTECVAWLRATTRLPETQIEASLRPATPRMTIIRMLSNLKGLYARQENWTDAWKVQHRLATLQPTSYEERRDLALISIRAGRPAEAVNLLDTCLKDCPRDERQVLETHLDEAKSALARWN